MAPPLISLWPLEAGLEQVKKDTPALLAEVGVNIFP